MLAVDTVEGPSDEADLRLLDDARRRELLDNACVEQEARACGEKIAPPAELASSDPEVLRAALAREHDERLRAECLATMQAEVVQLALDLLVREPDLEGFFGGLTKNMVEETESRGCSVWLIDHEAGRCSLWLTYMNGQLYTSRNGNTEIRASDVKLSLEELRTEPGGRFQYDVPQKIVAVAKGSRDEQLTLTLQARRLLYKEDVLGEMGPLSRLLVSTVAAPMAYTYEDSYTLRIERKGEPVEVRRGTALTEFSYANKPSQLAAAF